MTKQSKLELDKILSANRRRLTPGKTLTRAQFIDMLQITGVSKKPNAKGNYATLHKENLKLVREQQRVNELMRMNGLYLKARDYYTRFEVCSRDDTKNIIVRYAGQVERNEVLEQTLDSAMVSRISSGTWSYYNRVLTNDGRIKRPTHITTSNNGRTTAAIQRVKHY